MTASPVKQYRQGMAALKAATIMLLALLMGAVSGSNGQAQQNQPVFLSPPQKLAPSTAVPPASGSEGDGSSADTVQPVAATPPPGGTGVQIDSLQTIDSDTAGTLTAEQGGFGADMWKGTERAIVERLLPQLPVSTSSADRATVGCGRW